MDLIFLLLFLPVWVPYRHLFQETHLSRPAAPATIEMEVKKILKQGDDGGYLIKQTLELLLHSLRLLCQGLEKPVMCLQ